MLICSSVYAISEHSETISRGQWPEYENGTNVVALPQVQTVLSKFAEHEKVSIEIRYPGGDAGRQWAEALSNWMVSYGVPKQYFILVPGSGGADRIVMVLIDRR